MVKTSRTTRPTPLFLPVTIVVIILLLGFSSLPNPNAGPPNVESESFDYLPLLNAVNVSAVREHVEFFSSLATRATGYVGNDLAAEYIYTKFREYGLKNVSYQEFSVVDCISYGANVTVSNVTITVHPLVPNFICPSTTPPDGITGKLIYVEGVGDLRDFDGKDVNGSIVLMEWNSEANWLNAPRLGAKAVIFLPPKYLLGSLYGAVGWKKTEPAPVTKCLWETPLNFPRFYAEEPEAKILQENVGKTVRLVSTQRWTEVTGKNVVGFIEGTQRPEGIVILSSYYDSYSIVPTLAPGAQEALGVSSLLELARYLAEEENKPPITIMVVAYGGHHQALAGAISFANEHYFPASNLTRQAMGKRIWRQYNLDLSTGSNYVYMTQTGATFEFYNVHKSCLNPPGFLASQTTEYRSDLLNYFDELDAAFPNRYHAHIKLGYTWNEKIDDELYPYLMPTKNFGYDHETTNYIGPAGWTFTTAYDPRPYYWEPFDTIEKVNWENLQVQLECIYALLLRSLKEALDELDPNFVFDFAPPSIRYNTWEWSDRQHWATITGKVATWVEERAFWEPLKRSDLGNLQKTLIFLEGVRPMDRRFFFAEDDGSFKITGGILHEAGREEERKKITYKISAWVLDPVTGNVAFAPDMGPHKYPMRLDFRNPINDVGLLTVFNASTLAMLDLVYPVNLGQPQSETTGEYFPPSVFIYETDTYVPPVSYGTWTEAARICVLAFPPNQPVTVAAGAAGDRYPFIVLNNGTAEKPLGNGFSVGLNEQKIIAFPTLQYAEDFYYLNQERMQTLSQFMDISNLAIYELNKTSRELIDEALAAKDAGNFSGAYASSVYAWQYGREAYLSARQSLEDATSVVPFFAALILPFTFLCEKLLFDLKGLRKVLSMAGIFTVAMIALYLVHPGFKIAASPVSIIIGFSVLILSLPIVLIVFSEASALMKALRIKAVGVHEAEISRSGQAIYAFSTGVENMKRRKFRTILTMVSMIIMVSSLVGFTALSAIRVPVVIPETKGSKLYEGVYIHKFEWGHGKYDLGQPLADYIMGKYGGQALIVPRAWKYTLWPTLQGQWGDIGFTVTRGDKGIIPKALLGLTPEETLLIPGLEFFLKEGGRWFEQGEHASCILSEEQAQDLGINPDDPNALPTNITMEGIPLKVIGIIAKKLDPQGRPYYPFEYVMDLHEEITPLKRDMPEEENPWNWHLSVEEKEFLIMTYEDVMLLDGKTASISIKPSDPTIVREIADDIYRTLPGFLVYSYSKEEPPRPGDIILQRQRLDITVGGMGTQIVPLVIVVLTLFNIMLGSVYERKKEVAIYGAVGLSPLHVAMVFVAETVVYGIIGGVIGYLAAILQLKAYQHFNPAFPVNYSSNMVIIAVITAILASLLSAAYPAYLSSKLVTPSLERAWKVPTSPKGDVWEVPLPFFAVSETEAKSIFAYLHEFLTQHQISDAPVFMASNLQMESGISEQRRLLKISADCRLVPYHIGLSQRMEITSTEVKPDRWEFRVIVQRTRGAIKEWVRLNRGVLNLFREQLLLWRTLPEAERRKYVG